MRIPLLLLTVPALMAAQTPQLSPVEQMYRDRKFDELRTMMRAQITRDKNDHVAIYWMGRMAEADNRNGEAVDWFEKAVKLRDTSALYHYWLGAALGGEAQNANKLRQPFLARRTKGEFERAVALDPKMLDPRFGLVDYYAMAPGIVGGSIEKAKEQAKEIGKMHPFRGHFADARIANKQRDLPAEEAAYKAAVAAMPDSVTTYYQLASFYRRNSRWDEAFVVYDSLMKHHPQEIPVHASYGVVASQSGKHLERGETELKRYLATPPNGVNPQTLSFVRYHLGQIYEKTSRKEPARAEYTEALKLNKDNADAKKALGNLK
jgi:tetratricopeptide (TPR) repeat protein